MPKPTPAGDDAGPFDVWSADGTRFTGWRNGGDGTPVVISNGLGTPPAAWPAITGDPGLRVLTWFHRGTAGGSRPADRSRIRISDHAADLVALLDAEGVDRAVLVGWSLGVNVAFETARRYPERVAGVLAVAGLPGGTFDAIGGSLLPGGRLLPRRLRLGLGLGTAHVLQRLAPALNLLRPLVPANRTTALLARAARIVGAEATPEVVVPALAEFRRHDWSWYFELAIAAAPHEAMDLSFLPTDLPVGFVAGRRDLLTSSREVLQAASRLPHASVEILPGSHFLPLEFPHELREALQSVIDASDLGDGAAAREIGTA